MPKLMRCMHPPIQIILHHGGMSTSEQACQTRCHLWGSHQGIYQYSSLLPVVSGQTTSCSLWYIWVDLRSPCASKLLMASILAVLANSTISFSCKHLYTYTSQAAVEFRVFDLMCKGPFTSASTSLLQSLLLLLFITCLSPVLQGGQQAALSASLWVLPLNKINLILIASAPPQAPNAPGGLFSHSELHSLHGMEGCCQSPIP